MTIDFSDNDTTDGGTANLGDVLGAAVAPEEVPPLSPRRQVFRVALVFLFIVSFTLLLQLVLLSRLQASSAQGRAFDAFRADLAKGTAPIGPTDQNGYQLAMGTPIAYLEIPRLDMQQVVFEGTTSGVLFDGPGHRRDTMLPGQIGTSVVYGRRAAYGGPFGDITKLHTGDGLTVTTGQGVFKYRVLDVRFEGDPVPPPPAQGGARLVLATAAGTPFLPAGVVRVDADLVGVAVGGPARLMSETSLPHEETALAGDSRTLWALAFALQALIALSIGAVWAWHRWGRAQAWIVFLPVLLLVGLWASGEVARMLPNLL
jgi:sortase (surface protein transpeptidase)